MKRLALIGLVLLVAFLISTTVHAGPKGKILGTFCTDVGLDIACDPDSFTTKFFKEKFFGGGPGQPGNVLMAKGQGFMLQNVVLQEATLCSEVGTDCGLVSTDPCYATDWTYKTVYEGGMLTLNSKGPWLDKGMLKAKGLITATNYSRNDTEGNLLGFCMVITGEFKNGLNSFNAVALFEVTSDNYQFKQDEEGKPVFQRGNDFDAVITIE